MSSLPSERTQLQSHPPDTPAQLDIERKKERHWEGEGERKRDREGEQGTGATESVVYSPIRAKPPKVFPFSLMVPRNVNTLGT